MNLYIFNEIRLGAVYGIGTYIRELILTLKNSDINVCVVNLNSDKPQIISEETDGVLHLYFPSPIQWSKELSEHWDLYHRNVVYWLQLHIKDRDNLIFHLNYNQKNELAKELKIKQRIVFLGTTPNPYPYIKAVDLFVHTSLFEGKSIALDEAKLLCKPIVVTNFSTVHDQFEDHVNATIVEMTPESIANGIEELLMNQDLQKRYIQNLKDYQCDNTSEVQKLYSLF